MPLFLIAARLVKNLNRYRVAALVTLAVAVVLAGAVAFSLTQHVSIGLALYWSITTATTVGYGDVTPHDTAGRVIANLVMLTTIPIVGAVFALVAGATVITRLRRILGMDNSLPMSPYTVVYGTHPVLPRVLDELIGSGDGAVLVAPTRPATLGEEHHFIAGDPTDENVVRHSHPEQANRALIACTVDSDTLVTAVHLHAIAPDLEIYALSQSANVASALHDLGVDHTLSSDELVGHTLAKSLETPQAGDVLLSLVDGSSYRMTQDPAPAELVGKPLSAARAATGALVLGLVRAGAVDFGLEVDPVIATGDALVTVRVAAGQT
jgi:voltage-gated potassium channel